MQRIHIFAETRTHDIHANMGNNSCSCEKDSQSGERSVEESPGLRIKIVAPPGTLGIVFKGIAGQPGHEVYQMRATSPLLGKLQAGDEICEVDGVDTSHFDHDQIREILSERRDAERRITVLRSRGPA